jgi:RNA polymerase primary sigma factor
MDLSKYYAEICKEPMLSSEEETRLFTLYNNPDTSKEEAEKIRERIIKSNLRFAFKQAKEYSKNEPGSFEDLITAANEGLVVGFDKYKFDKNVRFLSYAGWWVKQRILKEMSRMRIVSLPIWKQQLASRIQKILDNNPQISLSELKIHFSESGVSERDIEELYKTRYLTYYISDLDENEFEIDPIGEGVQVKIDNEKVWVAVNKLPSPHREVIAKCFGFDDGDEHSPAKMSKALKVSKEEIHKIRSEALDMLRNILSST